MRKPIAIAATRCKSLKRFEDALASYDHALALQPNLAEVALQSRQCAHGAQALRRGANKLRSRARAAAGLYVDAHCNRGNSLHEVKRFEEALTSYDRALALRPDYAEVHCNRGNTLQAFKRFEEALASYDRAFALQPNLAMAHYNRGNALQELKRFEGALASYDRALALRPDFAEAHCDRANSLRELKRFAEALRELRSCIGVAAGLCGGSLQSRQRAARPETF